MKADKVGIGLVGHGAIALEHIAALQTPRSTIRAVMGRDKERVRSFGSTHGIARCTTELSEILAAEDIDAVVITSPNQLHEDQVIEAAEMGKHVLCEVPLATSYEGAERIAGAVAATEVVAMVCQTQRFFPSVARLRQLVESGDLDPVHLISVTGLRRRTNENVGMTGGTRRWVDSIIWHHGSHAVDTACFLLNDEIAEVQANTGRPDAASGAPLDVSIALRTKSGRLATIALSYSALRPVAEVILIGESETFRITEGVLRQPEELTSDDTGSLSAISAAVRAQDDLFVSSVLGEAVARPTPVELLPRFLALRDVDAQVNARLVPSSEGSKK
jgi:2-hydroxy-4-carboxymuconate semialdehyde hemiacetal dehydrogenase